MRKAARALVAMGPLPPEAAADPADLDRRAELLEELGLSPPTSDEISALMGLFPPDDSSCFGLAWTLVHLIETGRSWPIWDALDSHSGYWIDTLRIGLNNAGIEPPSARQSGAIGAR